MNLHGVFVCGVGVLQGKGGCNGGETGGRGTIVWILYFYVWHGERWFGGVGRFFLSTSVRVSEISAGRLHRLDRLVLFY